MKNKRIKRMALKKINHGYWQSLIVSFIVLIFLSGGYRYSTVIQKPFNTLRDNYIVKKDLFIVGDIIHGFEKLSNKPLEYHPTKGVLSIIFNQSIVNRSVVLGIASTIILSINKKSLPNLYIELGGILIILLIYIFVLNILRVGKNRYYIEKHKFKKSYVDKLFFPYRVKKTINVAYIMLIKDIYNLLWCFTIIGGIYKYYSYFMIPYILAENPRLKIDKAFETSKIMMQGNKKKLFLLQLSLIPYELLGILTFNISNIFFFNIYKEMIYSEFYFNIRNNLLKDESYRIIFKDENLDGYYSSGSYPSKDYFIKESNKRKWLKIDYNKNYSISTIILFFFSCAIIGFIWEMFLNLIMGGYIVKKGTMHGPWIPIYGYGAVIIIVLLKKYRDKPWRLFILSFLLCGIIEYFTAVYLEIVYHMKWWDYSGYFLNIQGKVCLEGLLIFGIAGVALTYVLAPLLDNIFSKINIKRKRLFVIILVILYFVDLSISIFFPNSTAGTSVCINLIRFL